MHATLYTITDIVAIRYLCIIVCILTLPLAIKTSRLTLKYTLLINIYIDFTDKICRDIHIMRKLSIHNTKYALCDYLRETKDAICN